MTALKDLQHEVATLLAAITTAVALVPVIEDTGATEAETAYTTALEDRGAALVVGVPTTGKLASQVTGCTKPLVLVDVEISVGVRVDIVRNTIGAASPNALGANIFSLISGVVSALASRSTVNPNDDYKVAPDALALDHYDAGLFGYSVNFIKRCSL